MSVAILSMVLAMVYGVFFSMLRGTEAGAETALQVQRNRVALKTLEDAFSGLVYYEPDKDNPNTGVYAFIVDTLDFDYPSVSFVSRVPPDFLGNKEFGSQTLRRITFQVEDDDDFGRSLVMYQSAALQPEYDLEVEEPSRWVLGQDLDQFLMLFYSTSVEEWINEWDDTNSVPSRIKFELAYARPDGGAASIEDMHKREFSLFSRNITKEMRLQKLKPAPKKPSRVPSRVPSRGSSDKKPDSSSGGRKISDFKKSGINENKISISADKTNIFDKEKTKKELNIILKSDVQGSSEALKNAIDKIEHPEVKPKIILFDIGMINETDVSLAKASNAVIIGYNIKPNREAKKSAEVQKVRIEFFNIIYQAIEFVENNLSGLLEPERKEKVEGMAEILKIFKLSKSGKVAGSKVTEGEIKNNSKARILRDGKVVHDGSISSIFREKNAVKEVKHGLECGISFKNFADFKEKDIIESYTVDVIRREIHD